LASCGEAAGGEGPLPGMDGWSGIWNRQGSTNSGAGRASGRSDGPGFRRREKVGHPPVGMAGALEEERESTSAFEKLDDGRGGKV